MVARRTFGLCLAKDWGLWPQATLKTFSQNDKQLAGTPGAVAVLHTHNRHLGFHPHVHVCMPAAALHTALDTGRRLWRTKVRLGKAPGSRAPARGGYLFNHKVLATRVRHQTSQVLDPYRPDRWNCHYSRGNWGSTVGFLMLSAARASAWRG